MGGFVECTSWWWKYVSRVSRFTCTDQGWLGGARRHRFVWRDLAFIKWSATVGCKLRKIIYIFVLYGKLMRLECESSVGVAKAPNRRVVFERYKMVMFPGRRCWDPTCWESCRVGPVPRDGRLGLLRQFPVHFTWVSEFMTWSSTCEVLARETLIMFTYDSIPLRIHDVYENWRTGNMERLPLRSFKCCTKLKEMKSSQPPSVISKGVGKKAFLLVMIVELNDYTL